MITFIYSTCRKTPMLEWFVDSLYNQANEIVFDLSKIQIVIVDFELQSRDQDEIKRIINNRFDFVQKWGCTLINLLLFIVFCCSLILLLY